MFISNQDNTLWEFQAKAVVSRWNGKKQLHLYTWTIQWNKRTSTEPIVHNYMHAFTKCAQDAIPRRETSNFLLHAVPFPFDCLYMYVFPPAGAHAPEILQGVTKKESLQVTHRGMICCVWFTWSHAGHCFTVMFPFILYYKTRHIYLIVVLYKNWSRDPCWWHHVGTHLYGHPING
jgi:hypothetical protein